MLKKFLSLAILIDLIAILWSTARDGGFLPLFLYLFFLLCGLEKLRSWLSNEPIRIGPMVKLTKDAPPSIRAIGLIVSLVLIFCGCFMLINEAMKIWFMASPL